MIAFLGILDIFGFESFARNGIEELCINYANERLQLYFIQEYLALGQRDLWKEGLSDLPAPDTINFYENRLSVIECYLFSTLNDVGLFFTFLSKKTILLYYQNKNLFSGQSVSCPM